jgi:hypothetical protein
MIFYMIDNDVNILMEFLSYPLDSGKEILRRFAGLTKTLAREAPVHYVNPDNQLQQFVYIPGTRKNKVLLVAHADTKWDKDYQFALVAGNRFVIDGKLISSAGIGSDGRAGCAILWLLKDLGHSLLVTNGEYGNLRKMIPSLGGSRWLIERHPEIADEINMNHQFAVQFDFRNGGEFKCYGVGTSGFRQYVREETGFKDAGKDGSKDICMVCRDICGVNLSVGYDKENTTAEILNSEQWNHTLDICREWLNESDLPGFPLRKGNEDQFL